MIKYKLTPQDMLTCRPSPGAVGEKQIITPSRNGRGSTLVFHGYHSPEQAVLFNPIHANTENPRLWRVEIDSVCADDKLNFGCKEMTLLEELQLPIFTIEQRVAFAIYCAEPFISVGGKRWAADWLNGSDRTAVSAARVVEVAARAPERAVEWAARAAWASKRAVEWAALAAEQATALAADRSADRSAEWARVVAEEVARAEGAAQKAQKAAKWAAAMAAEQAGMDNQELDFQEIIERIRNENTDFHKD